ncbi:flagellar protein FlaG [uncultured Psychromonas sp.]|uniref:flagellar protein FlaG n=1 Tax=uncultured Psychromonas sp. TaxID=173974 RepID=UPI0026084140|nr:flagellar protein FlaG [uncultured Psychromonas sp.]
MSELNIATSAVGYTGIKQDNSVDSLVKASISPSEAVVTEATQATNALQIDKELKGMPLEKEQPLTDKEVNDTVDELNSFLQDMKRNLSFSVDDTSGESVILVKDSESEEVIRQIPSEELVVLRKKMDDLTGLLFDTKV